MELTEQAAFRLGFLTRCAEEGLVGTALQGRVKQAFSGLETLAPLALGAGGMALASRVPGVSPILGLIPAAGLAVGGGLGYSAAKFTEPDVSADDIKAQELADTYRIYAQKMRANRAAKKYRQARGFA